MTKIFNNLQESLEDIDKEEFFGSIQKASIFSKLEEEDQRSCSPYTEQRCAKCKYMKRKEARSKRMSAEGRYRSCMSQPNLETSSVAITAQPSSTSRGTMPDGPPSTLDETTSATAKQTTSGSRRPRVSTDRNQESTRQSAEQRARLCCKVGKHSASCCDQRQQVGKSKSKPKATEETKIKKPVAKQIEKKVSRAVHTAENKRSVESPTVKSKKIPRGTKNEFVDKKEPAPEIKEHKTQKREHFCTCQSKKMCSDECKRASRGAG